MDAHPCPHRSSPERLAWCGLVGEFVGDRKRCGVQESLCKGCVAAGPADLANPNAFLASVAYVATNAAAKSANAAGDRAAWFHWNGLAHFFRARLMRGGKKTPPKDGAKVERPAKCEHLGQVKERKSCNCPREHRYECLRFRDTKGELPLLVSPNHECEGCPGYVAELD